MLIVKLSIPVIQVMIPVLVNTRCSSSSCSTMKVTTENMIVAKIVLAAVRGIMRDKKPSTCKYHDL